MRPYVRFLVGALAFSAALHSAHAVVVVDPSQPVAGISQLTLAEQWWQWVLGIPGPINPLLDPDGSRAQIDNDGPVFFVAGNLGGETGRSFTVPAGKPIFFPLLNNIDIEFAPPPDCPAHPGNPLQCALDFISPGLDNPQSLFAMFDGQDLDVDAGFRQTSTSFFDLLLSADNLIGLPDGAYPSVLDGYWVALQGLAPGQHTLTFGGVLANGFSVRVIDNINVVSEPATLVLVLLGALFGLRRATRITAR